MRNIAGADTSLRRYFTTGVYKDQVDTTSTNGEHYNLIVEAKMMQILQQVLIQMQDQVAKLEEEQVKAALDTALQHVYDERNLFDGYDISGYLEVYVLEMERQQIPEHLMVEEFGNLVAPEINDSVQEICTKHGESWDDFQATLKHKFVDHSWEQEFVLHSNDFMSNINITGKTEVILAIGFYVQSLQQQNKQLLQVIYDVECKEPHTDDMSENIAEHKTVSDEQDNHENRQYFHDVHTQLEAGLVVCETHELRNDEHAHLKGMPQVFENMNEELHKPLLLADSLIAHFEDTGQDADAIISAFTSGCEKCELDDMGGFFGAGTSSEGIQDQSLQCPDYLIGHLAASDKERDAKENKDCLETNVSMTDKTQNTQEACASMYSPRLQKDAAYSQLTDDEGLQSLHAQKDELMLSGRYKCTPSQAIELDSKGPTPLSLADQVLMKGMHDDVHKGDKISPAGLQECGIELEGVCDIGDSNSGVVSNEGCGGALILGCLGMPTGYSKDKRGDAMTSISELCCNHVYDQPPRAWKPIDDDTLDRKIDTIMLRYAGFYDSQVQRYLGERPMIVSLAEDRYPKILGDNMQDMKSVVGESHQVESEPSNGYKLWENDSGMEDTKHKDWLKLPNGVYIPKIQRASMPKQWWLFGCLQRFGRINNFQDGGSSTSQSLLHLSCWNQ